MRKKKILLCVILILALVVAVFFWLRWGRKNLALVHEIQDQEHLSGALMYYAEQNNGRLPGCWEDWVACGVIDLPDENGTTHTRRAIETNGIMTLFEWKIYDVRKFRIAFGITPGEITLPEHAFSDVLGPDGKPILLIAPVGETLFGEGSYKNRTLDIALVMKEYSRKLPTSKEATTKKALEDK